MANEPSNWSDATKRIIRCPKCGEDRLIEPTRIGYVCNVCSSEWVPVKG